MSEPLRLLTEQGLGDFKAYLSTLRADPSVPVPSDLLTSPLASRPWPGAETLVARQTFGNRFDFGRYLSDTLAGIERREISRNHSVWTWLALFYFDQLCPADAHGRRVPLSDEAYILPSKYDFRGYYRHLVRTPWLVVSDHGEYSKVLLIPASARASETTALRVRGEIIEQVASRQAVLGNRRIVEAVYRLYFDEAAGRPARGTGGSGGGSPRRLALVLQQLDLTFDLGSCEAGKLINLLPSEFERWRSET